jgi:hypothetical protein
MAPGSGSRSRSRSRSRSARSSPSAQEGPSASSGACVPVAERPLTRGVSGVYAPFLRPYESHRRTGGVRGAGAARNGSSVDRPVRDSGQTRRGRHGRGLPRRGARGPTAGRQTGAGRACRGPDLPGPFPSGGAGGADRGRARDVHRPCRRRGHRDRTALDGLGVHRRPESARRRPGPRPAARESGAVTGSRPRRGAHRDPRPGHGPPGPQAVQHPAGTGRTAGHRLRHRARAGGDRADPHRDRGRLGRVRLARADPQQRPGRAAERRLRARRGPRVRGSGA